MLILGIHLSIYPFRFSGGTAAPNVTFQDVGVSWQGDTNVTWQEAA